MTSDVVSGAAAGAPDGPGVYVFLAGDGELLYVGKATSLRKRLRQHAHSTAGGRLGVLYTAVAEVRWEELATEDDAAAREADLIVALVPSLNASLTGDGRWVYVVVHADGEHVRFTLSREPGGRRSYGCFAHLGVGVASRPAIACSEGYAGLMRLLWAAHEAQPRDQFPRPIAGVSPPQSFATTLPQAWHAPLHALLSGTSSRLLPELTAGTARLEPYLRPGLARDRLGAEAFFRYGPAALRRLRLRHRLPAGPMSRETVEQLLADDLRASIGEFRLPGRRQSDRPDLGRHAGRSATIRAAMRGLTEA